MSEIKILTFGFAPKGWAMCNGQTLPINQNQALFSLLGTTYGGNGQTTFGLPNLQGRVPVHFGAGFTLGQVGGEQAHTVTIQELPTHIHFAQGTSTTDNTVVTPVGNVLAGANNLYTSASNMTALSPASITSIGGSQAHLNMQPFLALLFCIALQGVFPSQN